MHRLSLAAILAFAAPVPAFAQEAPPAVPRHIPAPGGEVVITSGFDEQVYAEYHFAPLRRAGDFLFLSGVVVGASKPITPDEFGNRVDLTFAALDKKLKEAGATMGDVVAIRTYHVWKPHPNFTGTKEQHIAAFTAAKDKHVQAPYPTWTAIGIDQLYVDQGLVEIELTAYAPRKG